MVMNPEEIEKQRVRIELRIIKDLRRVLTVGNKQLISYEETELLHMYSKKISSSVIDEVTVMIVADMLRAEKTQAIDDQIAILQGNETEHGQQQAIIPLVCDNCGTIRDTNRLPVAPGDPWTCEPCNHVNPPLVDTKKEVPIRSPEKEPYGEVERKPPRIEWDLGASDRAATELYDMLRKHPEGVLQQDLVKSAGVSTAVASRVVNRLIAGNPTYFVRYEDESKKFCPRGIRTIDTVHMFPAPSDLICPGCGYIYQSNNKKHACRKGAIKRIRKEHVKKQEE